MIIDWYICFFVSLALCISSVLIATLKKNDSFSLAKSFILFFIASIVIYIPILTDSYGVLSSFFGNLLNSFQVISLDADYLGQKEIIESALGGSSLFSGVYIVLLGLIHIVMPILSLVVAYTLIFRWMSMLKMKYFCRHDIDTYIFSCASDRAVMLACDIFKNTKKKTCFIFTDDSGNADVSIPKIKGMKCICSKNDKFSSFNINLNKYKKNVHYFAISPNEDDNINDAISIIGMYSQCDSAVQKRVHIYLFSKKEETECIIDSSKKGIIDINIINEYKLAVYQLLDTQPLFKYAKNNTCSVLIIGLNDLGINFLKTCIWIGQLYGFDLKINLVDSDVNKKIMQIREDLPELMDGHYCINRYKVGMGEIDLDDTILKHCEDTNYCLICGDDDTGNIKTALKLRRGFLKNKSEFTQKPFIGVHIKSAEKQELVKNMSTPEARADRRVSYELYPFGGDNADCTYKQIVDHDLNDLAKNVHMAYEEIFSGSNHIDDINAAIEKYNTFEVNKSSNLANAMHIKYKLWALGLTYVKTDEAGEAVDFSELIHKDPKLLDELTIIEHDRWMAFLRSEGWTTASIDEVNKYKAEGVSGGRHNCPLLKMHPFICDFYDLPEISEKLGQQDATIYDTMLIAKIPEILDDKWGVSGKKYKIIKYKN